MDATGPVYRRNSSDPEPVVYDHWESIAARHLVIHIPTRCMFRIEIDPPEPADEAEPFEFVARYAGTEDGPPPPEEVLRHIGAMAVSWFYVCGYARDRDGGGFAPTAGAGLPVDRRG